MPGTYAENTVVARDVAVVAVAEGVVLDGGDSDRVVRVDNGEVELDGMTLTHGRADVGGGIMSSGSLTLNDCVVTDNVATGVNTVAGAGVYSSGAVSLVHTVVSNNRVELQPGGDAPVALGAGLFASGVFTMSDGSEVSGNTMDDGQVSAPLIGIGVLLDNAIATIADSSIHDNAATATGDTVTQAVQGGGAAVFSSQLTVSDTLIEHNTLADSQNSNAGLFGAGLYFSNSVVDLEPGVVVRENNLEAQAEITSVWGAGIAALDGSDLSLVEVTVDANEAAAEGLDAITRGGGLTVSGSPLTLSIRRSTISNNAVHGQNTAGGGLHVGGAQGTFEAVNVTVSGNDSTGSASSQGGGMFIAQNTGLEIDLSNVTVTDNSAGVGSGGGLALAGVLGPAVNLRNSIVAGNVGAEAPDCDSTVGFPTSSGGYNIFGTGNACFFSIFGPDLIADPLLEALADNGGGTLTHALEPTSLAIDAGNPSGCIDGMIPVAVDQRGQMRSQPCDVGAFELQP